MVVTIIILFLPHTELIDALRGAFAGVCLRLTLFWGLLLSINLVVATMKDSNDVETGKTDELNTETTIESQRSLRVFLCDSDNFKFSFKPKVF